MCTTSPSWRAATSASAASPHPTAHRTHRFVRNWEDQTAPLIGLNKPDSPSDPIIVRVSGVRISPPASALVRRHAAECLRRLPAVFGVDQRPWIFPDGADPDVVVEVVARCPTGALRTHPKSPKSEHRSPGPRSTPCPAALFSSAATSESAVQASTNRRPAPPVLVGQHGQRPTATGAAPAQTGRTHTAVSQGSRG
jgi:uncharacterized Fe-S cluster protein YjdI